MKFIKQLFCKHDWTWHGWSYVRCKKCDKKKVDEVLNQELQSRFWKERIIEGDPVFSSEAINNLLSKRGKSI